MSTDVKPQNVLNDDLVDDRAEAPRLASGEILKNELREAIDALDRPSRALFLSGVAAGLEVGFSMLLMASMYALCHEKLPEPVVSMLVALSYSFGFILVILGRSELFTEQTTLAVIPVVSGRTSFWSVLRLWGIVLPANLIGCAAFSFILSAIGPRLDIFGAEALRHIATRMTDHPGGTILLSGILAGWLMGLLSWSVSAVRDTISQIVTVGLITSTIGLCGLHHSVLGSTEVLAGVFAGAGPTLSDFGHFLLWTALGNAIGGATFVALIKSGYANVTTDK